jgi:hypothetical protein
LEQVEPELEQVEPEREPADPALKEGQLSPDQNAPAAKVGEPELDCARLDLAAGALPSYHSDSALRPLLWKCSATAPVGKFSARSRALVV